MCSSLFPSLPPSLPPYLGDTNISCFLLKSSSFLAILASVRGLKEGWEGGREGGDEESEAVTRITHAIK